MAIDFPTSPTDGQTYTFLNVVYTYVATGESDGYWAVKQARQVGPATITELNEGTDDTKYATPEGLNGSKYVREDQASGETVLKASGLERVKATAQGVEVTGRLDLGGTTYKHGKKVTKTRLWSGDTGVDGTIIDLSSSLSEFDDVVLVGEVQVATGFEVYLGSSVTTLGTNFMAVSNYGANVVDKQYPGANATKYTVLAVRYVSDTQLVIDAYHSAWSSALRVVYGLKYASDADN